MFNISRWDLKCHTKHLRRAKTKPVRANWLKPTGGHQDTQLQPPTLQTRFLKKYKKNRQDRIEEKIIVRDDDGNMLVTFYLFYGEKWWLFTK